MDKDLLHLFHLGKEKIPDALILGPKNWGQSPIHYCFAFDFNPFLIY